MSTTKPTLLLEHHLKELHDGSVSKGGQFAPGLPATVGTVHSIRPRRTAYAENTTWIRISDIKRNASAVRGRSWTVHKAPG